MAWCCGTLTATLLLRWRPWRHATPALLPRHVRFTVPEGLSRQSIAARLQAAEVCSAAEFLQATAAPPLAQLPSASGLDGYLFPDTYELSVPLPAPLVVERLLSNFQHRVAPLWAARRMDLLHLQSELGITPAQVITLASIVEKEAAIAAEQPIIAAVFLNRLRSPHFRPKRLQADPTVSYGCLAVQPPPASCRGFDGRSITAAMLAGRDNPYNTYQHEGLPPGPIANPGLAAIAAVLQPAVHAYLYFVAQGDGTHRFSATLEEHHRAVADRALKLPHGRRAAPLTSP